MTLVIKFVKKSIAPLISFWVGGMTLIVTMFHSRIGEFPTLNELLNLATWPYQTIKYYLGF